MPFHALEHVAQHEQMPGFHGRFIHGETVTIAHWDVEEGAVLPEHAHPHEQVSNLLEGEFEMTIDGHTEHLHAGAVAVVPSGAVHSGRTLSRCRFVDVFQPVREDYRV